MSLGELEKNNDETDMEPKLVNDRCVGNEASGWMDIWMWEAPSLQGD